jgi:hypothetical protein
MQSYLGLMYDAIAELSQSKPGTDVEEIETWMLDNHPHLVCICLPPIHGCHALRVR